MKIYIHNEKAFIEQLLLRITLIDIIFNYMKNININNLHTRQLDS